MRKMENCRLFFRSVCESIILWFIFAACFICEIATITNLTLSVGVTILGFCFWLVLIFYKVAPKVFPKFLLLTMTNLDIMVVLISEMNGCINILMYLNNSMRKE